MNGKNKSEPATKADLQDLATKADLKALVLTTTDLKKLELTTKSNLQKLEQTTKADLAAVEIKLSIAIAKTQADIREIKETIATKLSTKDDISRVMSAIDAFAAEASAYRNHDTLRGRAIMDHTVKISEHETRLTLLETGK